ncbi:MAG: CoA ester lyase [Burkholderiales bacterium]
MRSLLFVPGDDERKLAKGLACAADALILDLEDSVAAPRKPAARGLCAEVLRSARTEKRLYLRINALDSGFAQDDLAAVVAEKPAGIMLPKCRHGADARQLAAMLSRLETEAGLPAGGIGILPIATETGASMFGLGSYADPPIPRLHGLLWGAEDLAADLGSLAKHEADGSYTAPYHLARALCLYGAAAASTIAIDAVYVNFRDAAGLRAEAEAGVRDGFQGKACIHPDQAEVINEAYTPSPAAIEEARRIVAAFDASPGMGVVAMEGRMVDRPHYVAAQRVLARAGRA